MKGYHAVVGLCLALAFAGCQGGGSGEPNSGVAPLGEEGARSAAPTGSQAHYETVVEMLRGKVPGLEVVEVESGRIEVRIRGMTQSLQATGQEPLIVVDGVPSPRPAGEVLMSLNPNQVATISVLRDVSSTAIYGTRGANGVILVQMVKRD